MYDLIIRGGKIVDGTGGAPFVGDVAVKDGRIAAIGETVDGDAVRVIDATDRLVTPGFVDIHTHYDGQVTWDDQMSPSSHHGVTTLIMGNCGVGFAPVRPGQEEWLIQLMEGVEDIPGTALAEGMTWGWETFPEYLDVLAQRRLTVDVGAQVAHGAVRGYVMGERGARNEPATPEDIAQMRAIVREAIEAGALGVTTSRVLGHRAMDGEPVPGTFAAHDELFALGYALRDAGTGVFELAPARLRRAGRDPGARRNGVDAQALGRDRSPCHVRHEPGGGRSRAVADAAGRIAGGLRRRIPVLPAGGGPPLRDADRPADPPRLSPSARRSSRWPTRTCPCPSSWRACASPMCAAAILAEENLPIDPSLMWDMMPAAMERFANRLYPMGPGSTMSRCRSVRWPSWLRPRASPHSSCSMTSCSKMRAAP